MIRLLDSRALEHLDAQDPVMDGKARLDNLMEWALRTRLEGGLPFTFNQSACAGHADAQRPLLLAYLQAAQAVAATRRAGPYRG